MTRGRLITVLLLLVPLLRADPPAQPVTDPAAAQQQYHALLARPEFHDPDDTSTDLRWSDWLTQWLTHLMTGFQDMKYAGQISGLARILVYVLTGMAIAGLIYLIVRLSRRRQGEALAMMDQAAGKSPLLSPRQYQSRLQGALERSDWHGAWLAAWLQLLARLEQRHFVDADRSRTNREYLHQLRTRPLPPATLPLLAGLVDDYDRFIYGLLTVDETVWQAFSHRIEEVNLLLNLREDAGRGGA